MIEVQIDKQALDQKYREEIEKHLRDLDKQLVYWDTKELKRRTCMSWNTIQDTFFHEEGFPKVKIGGKWYFPAEETTQFLNDWLYRKRKKNYYQFQRKNA
ncbi:group-specific protein [Lentibacillus amyloliquefaciens]|uniref:Group-specific protein n=1 Tax=Lentibacillus amyloliquefaciens TaxID=1472767 RepID=A0A0U4E457_9BACI|nr:group-specific protein [Lentibacillus amyloliquefaciens]ALX47697.1 group-specific protein [Lentibacillus amyloliquefaciens]